MTVKRIPIAFLASLLMFCCIFSGCSKNKTPNVRDYPDYDTVAARRAGSMATFADTIYDVESFGSFDFYTDIFVVRFDNPGEYEIKQTGQIEYDEWGNAFDWRSYGAETTATVERILKGNSAQVGQAVTIGEKLYSDAEGAYNSRYFADPNLIRAIVCAHYDESYGAYICHTPEWCIIPLEDDNSISLWPYLNGADSYTTLESFATMIQQQRQVAEVSALARQNQPGNGQEALSAAKRQALQQMLNNPENNGILCSEYAFFTGIDLDAALLPAGLHSQTEHAEELASYRSLTGEAVQKLFKIETADLRNYLQEKFTADETVFENFTWVYLDEYDAWYHAPYTVEPMEITIINGIVEDVIHTIHYRFTRGEVSGSGTVVYNDFGNLSYFESNDYH